MSNCHFRTLTFQPLYWMAFQTCRQCLLSLKISRLVTSMTLHNATWGEAWAEELAGSRRSYLCQNFLLGWAWRLLALLGGRDTGQLLRMPQEHPSRHATPSPFATSPGPCHSDGEPGNRQGGRRQSHLLAPPPRREHLLKPLCQCLPLFLSHSLCGTNLALIWCVDLVPDHRQSCPGCGCHWCVAPASDFNQEVKFFDSLCLLISKYGTHVKASAVLFSRKYLIWSFFFFFLMNTDVLTTSL